jgi:HD superfamily phosphohydrolase
MINLDDLRNRLARLAPTLWGDLSALAEEWTAPLLTRLNSHNPLPGYPKTFNDPVWGVIELFPWEVAILDSPLLQRLRGVRQLGMAHHVYPGACHDRLEHSRGVVEAAERMIRAVARNAGHRRRFGHDSAIVEPSDDDIVCTRLGALLHDIGHGPFSHVTEPLFRQRLAPEFDRLDDLLCESFERTAPVAPAEVIAVLLVLSKAVQGVIAHPRLAVPLHPQELTLALAARILGSRLFLKATYLAGVVSGPLDADKLDYMARDSHHAGLPMGLDLERLISKLEIVTITPDNAPNPDLARRARESPNQRFYELGLSLAGLNAYEQMVIGRVILYDRIYYHHKVRCAEVMVRSLISLAEEERGAPFQLRELFLRVSDDAMIAVLSGQMTAAGMRGGGERAGALGQAILDRQLYYRAFAFSPRFLAGGEDQHRAKLWNALVQDLSDDDGANRLARNIFARARQISACLPELRAAGDNLRPEHALIDLPFNHVTVPAGEILIRTETDHVETPNLFFDPERWSQAYEHRRHCGFVFAPRDYVALVCLAARLVFFDQFHIVQSPAADRAAKTLHRIPPEWLDHLFHAGLCTPEFRTAYS